MFIKFKMNNQDKDWRLQGQENYLLSKSLVYKNYADKVTKADHDHCEFCSEKFSDVIPDYLKSGYTTEDDYHWICEKCFFDFKEQFK